MFKIATKLAFVTLLLLGAGLFLSAGKASAATCAWAPGSDWGVTTGQHGNAMAGLKVYAHVGQRYDGSGDPNQGQPVNIGYEVNAYLPGGGDQRIFKYPPGSAGRDSAHWFRTGETLTAGVNGSKSVQCDGWDALGPGQAIPDPNNPGQLLDQWGNGWVLDCGNGGTSTEFWISNIENPGGQAGHWEVDVDGVDYTNDLAANPMGHFIVTNGDTRRVDLIWHAAPEPPPDVASECNSLYVRDGGTWTRPSDAKVFSSDDVRTRVRVEDSGGHVLVHPPNDNPSAYFYLNNEDRSWSYQPLGRHVIVTVVREYRSSSGVWNFAEDDSRTHYNCYNAGYAGAGCAISAAGNVAGKPRGVKAGSTIAVTVTVGNIGTLNLPSQLAGHEFWFDSDGGQTGGLQSVNIRLPTIGSGRALSFNTIINAPNAVGHYHFSGSPVYRGLMYPEDINCGYDIDVYQPFSASLGASSTLSPTDENPDTANYSTSVNLSPASPQVFISTHSTFYKKPIAGGQINLDSSPPGTGTYPGANWSGSKPIAAGSFTAGDQFCATIHADYTSGYIGPNGPGDIAETGGAADSQPSCPTVSNEPFFKVYGSGISAANGVAQTNGNCSANASNSGLLAGWNDNFDGPGADRGAGSQLSALALIKITGVASAQTDINRSPTDLTFANTDPSDKSSGRESPSLGGNFGATPTCITPPTRKTPTANIPASPAGVNTLPASANGNYQYNGNLILNGGTISGPTAIYVNGDVYINSPITYNLGGWSPGNIPSFELIATGNIYIDPQVTQLDGVYISQPKDATNGGIIYTCASATSPIVYKPRSDFAACNNQLLVNGSFTAGKVKLLRTFGSLRDEIPNPGGPGGSPLAITGAPQWSSAGPIPGMRCTHINEPSDPNTWDDNYLCVPSSSTVHLAWTHYDNSPYSDPSSAPGGDTGMLNTNYWQAHGYPFCIKWDVPPDYPHTWQDNSLCLDQNIPGLTFGPTDRTSSGQGCLKIIETADPDGQWASGYFLCAPLTGSTPPTSGAPFTDCNNAGIQITTATCAAEVFQFSPELYLTIPAPQPPSKGATQYDAITSLPPVL